MMRDGDGQLDGFVVLVLIVVRNTDAHVYK